MKFRNFLVKIKNFLSTPYGLILKTFFSLILLVYLFYKIDFEKFFTILGEINVLYALLLLFLIVFRHYISAIRFKILLSKKYKTELVNLTRQYLLASMFNVFLPSALGGDAVRVYYLKEDGINTQDGIFFVLIERFIGFFSLLFISFTCSFFIDIPYNIFLLIIGLFAAYSCMILITFSQKIKLPFLNFKIFEKSKNNIDLLRANPAIVNYSLMISLFYQFISIMLSYIVAIAFGINIPLLAFLVFVPLVWIFMMIPISLGGTGLREISFIYLFSLIGVAEEQSLVISLGTFLAMVLSALIGALIFFYEKFILKLTPAFLNKKITADGKEN